VILLASSNYILAPGQLRAARGLTNNAG